MAGPQTPDQPCSFNACLLYNICCKNRLITWPEMTYDDLVFAVKSLLVPSSFLLTHFVRQLQASSQQQLINTCLAYYRETHYPTNLPNPEDVSYEKLEQIHDFFSDITSLRDRILPKQTNDAIAIVALQYRLDISTSKYPFEELLALRENGEESYIPVDPDIANYYKVNPRLYSLEYQFNPLFPEKYYNRATLQNLMQKSGFPRDDHDNLYSQLCEVYYCNSFYHGFRPGIKNPISPYEKEDITDVDSNTVVCYGNPSDGFIFFLYTELADYFKINRAYLNPFDKRKQLIPGEIARLRLLASDNVYPHDKEEYQELRSKLFQAMSYVDAFNLEIEKDLKIFLDSYEESSEEIKKKIKEIFEKLFLTAMYMRGWSGPKEDGSFDAYPIEEAPKRPDEEVFPGVTFAIAVWKNHLREIGPEWKKKILNLPLVRYSDGFIVSNEVTIGQTIGEKFAIIKNGADHSNVIGSCIRASSGWLAASAYRYMTITGMEVPFQIHKLIYVT